MAGHPRANQIFSISLDANLIFWADGRIYLVGVKEGILVSQRHWIRFQGEGKNVFIHNRIDGP